MNGAIARIILRYGVGIFAGMAAGDALAADPDIVFILAAGVGVGIEAAYAMAKKKGWTT